MSTLDVWNKALGAAHARGALSSLTESSPEQEVCSLWYDITLRTVQEAAWWPSSKRLSRLALLSKQGSTWADGLPEPGYAYAYALPAGYLRAWHLTDYTPFSLSYSVSLSRTLLSTNTSEAVLIYAGLNEDTTMWSPEQQLATIYGLAGHISGQVNAKNSIIQGNFRLADDILLRAQMSSANSEEGEPRMLPPWIAARGYRNPYATRFFYPYGSLFSAGVADA